MHHESEKDKAVTHRQTYRETNRQTDVLIYAYTHTQICRELWHGTLFFIRHFPHINRTLFIAINNTDGQWREWTIKSLQSNLINWSDAAVRLWPASICLMKNKFGCSSKLLHNLSLYSRFISYSFHLKLEKPNTLFSVYTQLMVQVIICKESHTHPVYKVNYSFIIVF